MNHIDLVVGTTQVSPGRARLFERQEAGEACLARIFTLYRSGEPVLLNLQILALTLLPFLAGVHPSTGGAVTPLALLGIEERATEEFLVGTWKCTDDYFRWGVTDREDARVGRFRGKAFMVLNKDKTMKMVNLFRPRQGKWELTERGLLIYDPRFIERGSQVLVVKKRGKDRLLLLLPFAGGSTGVGMVRVPEGEAAAAASRPTVTPSRRATGRGRYRGLTLKDVKVEKLDFSEAFHGEPAPESGTSRRPADDL